MANSTYQLVVSGASNKFHDLVLKTLFSRLDDLGLERNLLEIIDKANFSNYKSNNPVVCIYYGGDPSIDLDIVQRVKDDASIILPVFNAVDGFFFEVPEILHSINGIRIESEIDIDAFINNILESFSLLRLSRRLFISYKRNESRGVAIQLYEKLEQSGFDVFLDTHSIKKGDVFQDELWHRLVDTDVVVLLNTPDFLKSFWTTEELAKANSMSIGILQLIWPENTPERSAELSVPLRLRKSDFLNDNYTDTNSNLSEVAIGDIIRQVEILRARSLAARQDNIITEFIKSAVTQGKIVTLQREKFITYNIKDGKEIVLIPTIGVPHAFSYHQSEDLIKLIRSHTVEKIYLLYDHRNIREKWLAHLAWLDGYLPVNSVRITEVDEWIKRH